MLCQPIVSVDSSGAVIAREVPQQALVIDEHIATLAIVQNGDVLKIAISEQGPYDGRYLVVSRLFRPIDRVSRCMTFHVEYAIGCLDVGHGALPHLLTVDLTKTVRLSSGRAQLFSAAGAMWKNMVQQRNRAARLLTCGNLFGNNMP